jgi:hypothetical protein
LPGTSGLRLAHGRRVRSSVQVTESFQHGSHADLGRVRPALARRSGARCRPALTRSVRSRQIGARLSREAHRRRRMRRGAGAGASAAHRPNRRGDRLQRASPRAQSGSFGLVWCERACSALQWMWAISISDRDTAPRRRRLESREVHRPNLLQQSVPVAVDRLEGEFHAHERRNSEHLVPERVAGSAQRALL